MGLAQPGDRRGVVAQPGKYRVGVLAKRRNRIHARLHAVGQSGRYQGGQRPCGGRDFGPAPARCELRVSPQSVHVVDVRIGDVRGVQARAAKLVFVVEQGAKSDKGVAALWRQIQANLRYGVEWATRTLLAKPGAEHLDASDVETTFWVALDWGTYRALTEYAGLTADDYERWLLEYYRRMFGLS